MLIDFPLFQLLFVLNFTNLIVMTDIIQQQEKNSHMWRTIANIKQCRVIFL